MQIVVGGEAGCKRADCSQQCCGSETFYYASGSDFSMSSRSGSNFQKVPVPVSDPTFFLKKYDFKGPKMGILKHTFQRILKYSY
jgi:hypothetical protein